MFLLVYIGTFLTMWIVIEATMIRTMMVLSASRSIKTPPMESLKVSQLAVY